MSQISYTAEYHRDFYFKNKEKYQQYYKDYYKKIPQKSSCVMFVILKFFILQDIINLTNIKINYNLNTRNIFLLFFVFKNL